MTDEQLALLERSRQSLEAARLLTEQGYPEFVISRAYYSMFYLAQALLLAGGLRFSKHSAVISAFGQHFAKTGRVPYAISCGRLPRHFCDCDQDSGLAQIQFDRCRYAVCNGHLC